MENNFILAAFVKHTTIQNIAFSNYISEKGAQTFHVYCSHDKKKQQNTHRWRLAEKKLQTMR